MIFGSDNWAGAAPEIGQALITHSTGMNVAYGGGDFDRQVYHRFEEIFEAPVGVYYLATGTAANSLSHALTMKPGGFTFCHDEAHMVEDELGAPQFLSAGGRLRRVSGANGKIDPDALRESILRYPKEFNHQGIPTMVSLTQATEIGTVYTIDEIRAISDVCKQFDMLLHMDGARFANALVHLDVNPAEMTWKLGVDLVSFGGTKNGCWCAEAMLVFNQELLETAHFLRKRSAQLFSKSRFISAQFQAYFANDLWLKLARHANAMGGQLRDGLRKTNSVRLAWEGEANMAFFIATGAVAERLQEAGARFHQIHVPASFTGELNADEKIYRLVASFATQEADVQAFFDLLD